MGIYEIIEYPKEGFGWMEGTEPLQSGLMRGVPATSPDPVNCDCHAHHEYRKKLEETLHVDEDDVRIYLAPFLFLSAN